MKFPYIKGKINPPSPFFGKILIRPIIPLKIKLKGNEINHLALVDSGADMCVFDMSLADYLDIDLSKAKKIDISGVTGVPLVGLIAEVKLEVGGHEFKTEVGFSDNISPNGFGFVGQKGFFEFFTVKFNFEKEEIELSLNATKFPN